MVSANNESSETSPLLTKPINTALEPGDAPVGALPSGNEVNGHANGVSKPDDEENQVTDGDEAAPYQGMPDVKKKLKYIVPAVAVGVREVPLDCSLKTFAESN